MFNFINKIYFFESLESTNKYLKDNYSKYKTGDIIIAKEQISGYGSRKRFWSSKKDMGIFMSLIIKHKLDLNDYKNLTYIAYKAVKSTLADHGLIAEITLPNDILINEKKVSGILTETFIKDNINISIIGIGLNLYQSLSDFDLKDNRNTPTSLLLEGISVNYEDILHLLLKHLDNEFYLYFSRNF